MVDCHREQQLDIFDQCGSQWQKYLYFGGLGQITDSITRFWSMNEMFRWVTTFGRHAIQFWGSSKQLWHLPLTV